jgi:hypothetical protein
MPESNSPVGSLMIIMLGMDVLLVSGDSYGRALIRHFM